MKQTPIILNTNQLQAILDGKMKQLICPIKPQPPCNCKYDINGNHNKAVCWSNDGKLFVPPTATSKTHLLPCPYGEIDDLIWCKEYCKILNKSSGYQNEYIIDDFDEPKITIEYFDKYTNTIEYEYKGRKNYFSALCMPMVATRIWLKITNIDIDRRSVGSEINPHVWVIDFNRIDIDI